MATITGFADSRTERIATSSFVWLGVGLALSMVALGGRWDIPLAAWFAPIFLLRFTRTSSMPLALGGIVLALTAQAMGLVASYGIAFNVQIALICLTLGVLYAVPYGLDRIFAGRLGPLGRLFLLPAAAALLEYLIAMTPTGASLLTRANSQGENLALLQIISLLGPYSIGFMIALGATAANQIWEAPSRQSWVRYGGSFAALMAAVLAYGQARIAYATHGAGPATVRVAGIVPRADLRQPASDGVTMANFPPSPAVRSATTTPEKRVLYAKIQEELIEDTRKAIASGAQLVVWSETAAQMLESDKAAFLPRIAEVARTGKAYVNIGVGVPFERNETFLFGPDGRQLWHYRKNNPVPAMEPVAPFKNAPPVVETPFGRLSNVICYDADFPSLSRVRTDVMLVPGWDWKEEAYVHTMKIARLRAIENGYSMLRVDYLGVTGAFDAYGRVLGQQNTLDGKRNVMYVDLPTQGVRTLYNLTGDLFAWICLAATVALCFLAASGRGRRGSIAA
ncbi:nitrilase-related carbon-nitrogen hydrolase [Phenylobacterium sp.]|uniref:nitrilase-related carbon-nitrogen hydrolase n=1 Tax=Phenylobacterium sp. TaxID=1871053 RepID=UPI002FC8CD9C